MFKNISEAKLEIIIYPFSLMKRAPFDNRRNLPLDLKTISGGEERLKPFLR
jgi:hypothetical protein